MGRNTERTPFAIMSDEEKIEELGWRNDSMSYAILSLNKSIAKGGHNIVNKDRYTVIGKRKYHRGAS